MTDIYVPSYDQLYTLNNNISKKQEENIVIANTFREKDLSISEYATNSLPKLLLSDFTTNIGGFIVCSLIVGIPTLLEWETIATIAAIIIFIGLLVLCFKHIIILAISLFILSIFELFDYALMYILIYIFVVRFSIVKSRKTMAINTLENNHIIEDSKVKIKEIIQNEIIPIAHNITIATLDSLRDMTNTMFIDKFLLYEALDTEYKNGNFELIKGLNEDGQDLYKSTLNLIPSSDHMDTIELTI